MSFEIFYLNIIIAVLSGGYCIVWPCLPNQWPAIDLLARWDISELVTEAHAGVPSTHRQEPRATSTGIPRGPGTSHKQLLPRIVSPRGFTNRISTSVLGNLWPINIIGKLRESVHENIPRGTIRHTCIPGYMVGYFRDTVRLARWFHVVTVRWLCGLMWWQCGDCRRVFPGDLAAGSLLRMLAMTF